MQREFASDAPDEVGNFLSPGCLRVGVVASAKHGHEQLDLRDLTGERVDEPGFHSRVVDEQLVAGDVDLTHHRRLALEPLPIALTNAE